MTETAIKTEREKFEALVVELKGAKADGEERFGKTEEAIEALKAQHIQMGKTIAAQHRAATESVTGPDRELGVYVARTADDGPMQVHARDMRDHYMVDETSGKAVRLTGHFQNIANGGELVKVWRPGLLDDPNPRTAAQLHAQRVATRRTIARVHCKDPFSPLADMELLGALRACGSDVEKIFADSSGIGGEWVPARTVPELEREIVIPTNFAGLFQRRTISPGGTVKLPFARNNLRVYKGVVPTANDPAGAILSSFATGERDVDTVPGVVATQIDRDASADSVFAVATVLMGMISDAYRFAEDDSILHGDTAASHQDAIAAWDNRGRLGGTTGLGTDADHRRRWDGLRARAYDLDALHSAGKTDQGAAKTWAGLRVAVGKLGADNQIAGHQDGADLIVAPSWEYFFNTMLDWSEFASWDKVGALASVLTGKLGAGSGPGGMLPGQVGFVGGMLPVCIPYPLGADYEASGLYTDGSGAKTAMLQFTRSRFEYVIRQGMSLESAAEIRNNTITYVSRLRTLFRPIDAVAATVKDVHVSYNL